MLRISRVRSSPTQTITKKCKLSFPHFEIKSNFFRLGITTYNSSFQVSRGRNSKAFRSMTRKMRNCCSGTPQHRVDRGKRISTLLIGEQYMDFEDPRKNSHVQRSWVYGRDSTMSRVEQKLNRTLQQLGGKASNKLVMSQMASNRQTKHLRGDLHNSLPLEGKFSLKINVLTSIQAEKRSSSLRSTSQERLGGFRAELRVLKISQLLSSKRRERVKILSLGNVKQFKSICLPFFLIFDVKFILSH